MIGPTRADEIEQLVIADERYVRQITETVDRLVVVPGRVVNVVARWATGRRPGSAAEPHMDVPVGEPVRWIRRAELPERVPGLLRYAAGRRVVDIMHEHDLPQACLPPRVRCRRRGCPGTGHPGGGAALAGARDRTVDPGVGQLAVTGDKACLVGALALAAESTQAARISW